MVGRTIHELYTPLSEATRGSTVSLGGQLLIEAIVIGSGVSVLGALGPSLDAGRTVIVGRPWRQVNMTSRQRGSRGVAWPGGCSFC